MPTPRPRRRLARPRRALGRAAGLVAALVISSRAAATPSLDGTRNLGMGNATRASATGSSAMLVNPANMGFTRQFLIDPGYQTHIESNAHSAGLLAMDSLLNARVALGLGYVFTVAGPKINFIDDRGAAQDLRLFHQTHEVGLPIAINAVPGWLAFAVRPKFQHSSLRFLDGLGKRNEARTPRNTFALDLAVTISFSRWANISVIGQNIVGPTPANTNLDLDPFIATEGSLDRRRVLPMSDFPRTLAHGLAIFPQRTPGFSLNFDGIYDFTSFRHQDRYTRMMFAGGAEYTIKNLVPLRFGGYWDSRGREKADDRGFIAFGLGFQRDAPPGGIGFDLGFAFSRQVTGPSLPETRLALNLGLRINPQ